MKETRPLVLRAESARLSRDAVEALAGEIPRDAGQVDGLLGECIEGYYARGFTTLALAALHAGVAVDADFLGFNLDPAFAAKQPKRAWLQRKELRQAVTHAVDRQAFANRGTPCRQKMPGIGTPARPAGC